MTGQSVAASRRRIIVPMALFFGYDLAFVFEGPVFYHLAGSHGLDHIALVMTAVVGQAVGLLGGGCLVTNPRAAKRWMIAGMTVTIGASGVFFGQPSAWWGPAMTVAALASGVTIAAWGQVWQVGVPAGRRVVSGVDMLIGANLAMVGLGGISTTLTAGAGLVAGLTLALAGLVATIRLPIDRGSTSDPSPRSPIKVAAPLALVVLFIFVVTINSGLMYQLVVPAYASVGPVTQWFWSLPYVVSLLVVRLIGARRTSASLYVSMGLIAVAFILFVVLGRGLTDYLVVDSLLLGGYGVLDLFWWAIVAQLLDLSRRPASIVGLCLAANVLGVLLGNLVALSARAARLTASEVTIVALSVVCVTLMLLPLLNRRLSALFDQPTGAARLHRPGSIRGDEPSSFIDSSDTSQLTAQPTLAVADHLTPRERDVCQRVVDGKSNKVIAAELTVSENTIKTHLRHIFRKYQVSTRSELISLFVKTAKNSHQN